ncbi:UPF0057-domain-containing protein [Eremomyces bilateralis CBS 781.70]|uniref:UPF0057-domain-containing protein n=1 Tax=Eremomyces bilateralis CBS 781.70 TaxID=1392243 RepID=A0A6G1GG01_9PEZI|nr:UPF0057-domain-containing protein [Eremomyces bilateralis CBS 781.70]KAF1816983.1 UPF0057-domain-containing protein [Eremomyces bilateralis CBS 781.70]
MCTSSDLFLALLAVLFPPIAVWIKVGVFTCSSLVNVLLTTIGYLPGLLHAWYIIAAYPDPNTYDYDYEALESGNADGATYPHEHAVDGVWIYVRDPRLARRAIVQSKHPNGYGAAAQEQQRGRGRESDRPAQRSYGTTGGQQSGVTGQHAATGGQSQAGGEGGGEGSAGGAAPPSYADVVAGDHKVQQHD